MKAVAHSSLDLLFLKSENLARKAVESIVRYLGLRQVARYPDVLLWMLMIFSQLYVLFKAKA